MDGGLSPLASQEAPRWYALHTRARHEKAVERRLRDQGMETLRADHDGSASLERSQEESRSAAVQLLCVCPLRFERGRPDARVPGGKCSWFCGNARVEPADPR